MQSAKEIARELENIQFVSGPDWYEDFIDRVSSLPHDLLEEALTIFIEEVVRNRIYDLETFSDVYNIMALAWHDVYLPWVELISKYGTKEMFQIMDEHVNTEDLWFYVLALSSAYQIDASRVKQVITWLEDGGHDIGELLEDYVSELNSSSINESEYDIALILELCTYLRLDIHAQEWVKDGGKVAQRIGPLLEEV